MPDAPSIAPAAAPRLQVLFVDDEPRVLEALRVALRGQRARWTMHFAGSGEAALALLPLQPFDVIVSDMRMPRVDGAQVLREALRLQPGAARLVLSGYAESESAVRTVSVAHQFLTKPCDVATLVNTIERTQAINELVSDRALQARLGRITTLPSPPRTFQAVLAALADGQSDAGALALIIERDVAMCAKMLQLVNSAFFGLPRRVANIEEAIIYLGFDMVRNLVLVAEVFRSGGEDLAALEWHSLTVAAVARRLATPAAANDACLAGMLHDLGTLALAGAAEHASHPKVGAYLLGLWGLPWAIVEAVANHRAPQEVAVLAPGALTAVAAADALVHEVEGRPLPEGLLRHLEALRLPDGTLAGWRAIARSLLAAGTV